MMTTAEARSVSDETRSLYETKAQDAAPAAAPPMPMQADSLAPLSASDNPTLVVEANAAAQSKAQAWSAENGRNRPQRFVLTNNAASFEVIELSDDDAPAAATSVRRKFKAQSDKVLQSLWEKGFVDIAPVLKKLEQRVQQSPGERTIFSSEPIAFEVAKAVAGGDALLWQNGVDESDDSAPPGAMGCDLDAGQSRELCSFVSWLVKDVESWVRVKPRGVHKSTLAQSEKGIAHQNAFAPLALERLPTARSPASTMQVTAAPTRASRPSRRVKEETEEKRLKLMSEEDLLAHMYIKAEAAREARRAAIEAELREEAKAADGAVLEASRVVARARAQQRAAEPTSAPRGSDATSRWGA